MMFNLTFFRNRPLLIAAGIMALVNACIDGVELTQKEKSDRRKKTRRKKKNQNVLHVYCIHCNRDFRVRKHVITRRRRQTQLTDCSVH